MNFFQFNIKIYKRGLYRLIEEVVSELNMRKFIVLLFTCGIQLLMGSCCWAQEETSCRGKDVILSEIEKSQVMDCLTEHKINSIWKIPIEKVACFGVCVLKKKNMLTDDGKINHEKALKYIDAHMPDKETKKLLIDAADKCIKEHGAQVADNDPLCHKFLDVGMCVHDAFLEICSS